MLIIGFDSLCDNPRGSSVRACAAISFLDSVGYWNSVLVNSYWEKPETTSALVVASKNSW